MKTAEKQLRYDYSELDKYLQEDISLKMLIEDFQNVHFALTHNLSRIINEEIKLEALIDTSGIYDLMQLFRILERLEENSGSSMEEDPDQSGSGPARCPNCDNKDKINSLLEKLLKEKEEEIDELKEINGSLQEKIDLLEEKKELVKD
jgi:hypothetical protein